ncbi:MAG: RluA family pseudouridine synthase [Clostridia bacterium]|nr:RluA family pseudouridine synthase [Clostridia bacterium]
MDFIVNSNFNKSFVRNFLREGQGFSSRQLSLLKRKGGIYVNGIPQNLNCEIVTGDIVSVVFPCEESSILPQKGSLHLLFEDDCILAVNKPPYLPCHPSAGHRENTLGNFVAGYFMEKGEKACVNIPGRLDANTSGIVLIAKNKYVQNQLAKQFKEGSISKKYIAIVEGSTENQGEINQPIARAEGSIIKREVNAEGKKAITRYKKIFENIFLQNNEKYSVVEVETLTGRTHQIRVHMSYIGHPLLGDFLYGTESKNFPRHMLHMKEIAFVHPITGEKMTITASLPEDMQYLLNFEK